MIKSRIFTLFHEFCLAPAADDAESWNGVDWRLVTDLRVMISDSILLEIPAGFVTDGASIPKFYRWRFSRLGKYVRAAVVHDWLYRMGGEGLTRKQCDQVFLVLMRQDGVGDWASKVMYRAVRVGGRGSYKEL